MTSNLKTSEIVDAAIARIVSQIGTTITFSPKIVQEGDFSFYTERSSLLKDLPAVFVIASSLALEPDDLTVSCWDIQHALRVLVVDSWETGESLPPRKKQQNHAEEIAQVFIGGVGYASDLGGVSGLRFLQAFPSHVDFEPAESKILSFDEERQLFAVAVTVQIQAQSEVV